MQNAKHATMNRSRGSYKRKHNNNIEADSNWTPTWKWKLNDKDDDSMSGTEKDFSHKLNSHESGNESDREKGNYCPVCHKSFSRSAALICHVRQNHNYMLNTNKESEPSLHSMKKEVMNWKSQHNRKSLSNSKETSHDAGISGSEKDSYSESCAKSTDNTDQEESDNFLIIGGSASKAKDKCTNSCNSVLSFLSDTANADLLDPDQSFSVVRKNSRKLAKVNREKNEKKSNGPPPPSGFESVDLSIDNSPEELKTLECFVCHKRFSNSRLLTYHHMRNHMDEDFRQCPKCGSVFYDHEMFMNHCSLHGNSR